MNPFYFSLAVLSLAPTLGFGYLLVEQVRHLPRLTTTTSRFVSVLAATCFLGITGAFGSLTYYVLRRAFGG